MKVSKQNRILQNNKFRYLHGSLLKYTWLGWAVEVASMGKMWNAFTILIRKPLVCLED
jgi:hypothetical protein